MRSNRFLTGFSNRAALFVLASLFLIGAENHAAPAGAIVGVLQYRSDVAGATTITALQSAIVAVIKKEKLLELPQSEIGAHRYEYNPVAVISPQALAQYEAICGLTNCTYLIMGKIYTAGGVLITETGIFSLQEKRFLCVFSDPATDAAMKIPGAMIARKASLFLHGKLPVVSDLKISQGTSPEKISLSWKSTGPQQYFIITRSAFERGPFEKIGETKSTGFVDTTAEEGIKYWFTVAVVKNELSGISATGNGYRRQKSPKSLTEDDIIEPRTRPRPEPTTEEEREREKLHLELLGKYYESPFMVTFIIMVGRSYINSGELIAYRDFTSYSWDPGNRIIYFYKQGMTPVRLYSKRFFRFVRDMHIMKIPFDELLPRVIGNAVLFCIRTKDRETRELDGRIRYLPYFEVVGMSTEYHVNYEKWRSNTMVFGSSDEEIYRRMREAAKMGN